MNVLKNIIKHGEYALYAAYLGGAKYETPLTNSKVYKGYFANNDAGKYQQMFYNDLINLGFEKTMWQIIFPGQTAGLIKKIPPTTEGINEYHVRFYYDGTIDLELEVERFDKEHWTGPRAHSPKMLERILENDINEISPDDKEAIKQLFGVKPWSYFCRLSLIPADGIPIMKKIRIIDEL